MSMYPKTIELTEENIKRFNIYKEREEYYLKPKRHYNYFICKGCNKEFIRLDGKLLYCSNKCSNPIINQKNKLDFDLLSKSFEDEGYVLHTKEYINRYQFLYFTCPNGHYHRISVGNWISGQRCGKCRKNSPISNEQILKLFNSNGYTVFIPEYKISGYRTKLNYKCPNGHSHYITYTAFKRGIRCPYCQNQAQIEFSDIKKSFEDEGYNVITKEDEYKTQNTTKIEFICPAKHRHSISVRHWRDGQRCGKCSVSKEEIEIRKFINTLNITYIMNDRRTIINPNTNHFLELDLYFPHLKKAIEINGEYWHSRSEKKINDVIKKKQCELDNIQLLTISDKDWNKSSYNTKNRIEIFLSDKELEMN